MINQEDFELLSHDKALDAILGLSAAIGYASITGRIDMTLNMGHTLLQLIHACTDRKGVTFTTVDMDNELARDIARSVAASVYTATFEYESWIQEDYKNDC